MALSSCCTRERRAASIGASGEGNAPFIVSPLPALSSRREFADLERDCNLGGARELFAPSPLRAFWVRGSGGVQWAWAARVRAPSRAAARARDGPTRLRGPVRLIRERSVAGGAATL